LTLRTHEKCVGTGDNWGNFDFQSSVKKEVPGPKKPKVMGGGEEKKKSQVDHLTFPAGGLCKKKRSTSKRVESL